MPQYSFRGTQGVRVRAIARGRFGRYSILTAGVGVNMSRSAAFSLPETSYDTKRVKPSSTPSVLIGGIMDSSRCDPQEQVSNLLDSGVGTDMPTSRVQVPSVDAGGASSRQAMVRLSRVGLRTH